MDIKLAGKKKTCLLNFGRKLFPSELIIGKYIDSSMPDCGGMHRLYFCFCFLKFIKKKKYMVTLNTVGNFVCNVTTIPGQQRGRVKYEQTVMVC